jgi:pheromone a factor receptor
MFFAFFGFADEAQKHYKIAFDSVAKRVGYTTTTGSTKIGTGITSSTGYVDIFFEGMYIALHYSPSFNKFKGGSSKIASSQGAGMPIFVRQEVVEKRDSFDSLSDMTSVKESVYESETGSNPSSPFNTLTKTSIAQNTPGLKPPGTSSSESTLTTSTVVETARRHPISFPASITPSGSFLDLSVSKEGPGNDNKV